MARRQPPYQKLAGPGPGRSGTFHHGGGLRQLSGHAGALISWNYDQGAAELRPLIAQALAGALISWNYDQGADAVPFAATPRRGGAGWDRQGSRQARHSEDQFGRPARRH